MRRVPALDIRLPAAPESLLPRLDALLDDYEPFAVSDGSDGEPAGTGAEHRSSFLERRVYLLLGACPRRRATGDSASPGT